MHPPARYLTLQLLSNSSPTLSALPPQPPLTHALLQCDSGDFDIEGEDGGSVTDGSVRHARVLLELPVRRGGVSSVFLKSTVIEERGI